MPKYWWGNYFAHGRFSKVGQKQKTEKKKKEERLNDGENNGQATHGARKHAWRTQAAWANKDKQDLSNVPNFSHESCHIGWNMKKIKARYFICALSSDLSYPLPMLVLIHHKMTLVQKSGHCSRSGTISKPADVLIRDAKSIQTCELGSQKIFWL